MAPATLAANDCASVIPIVLCIDVEPNERELDPNLRAEWTGFEVVSDFFSKLRVRLEALTGRAACFSWFLRMDPQIEQVYGEASWVAERYREEIARFITAGDAIGLHCHASRWNLRQR